VLDPSQSLRGKRDIGIRNAVIAAVEPEIPADRTKQLLDVGGKLVFPRLVDLHAHTYHQGSAISLPADELVSFTGTDTADFRRRRGFRTRPLHMAQ
jgi:dihydroorotase